MSYSSSPGTGGTYDVFNSAPSATKGGVHTRQKGFDFFGHARLGKSRVTAFGLFQYFKPNTSFNSSTIDLTDNPMDFTRTVGGISYKVTDHFDVAFGDQNFHWVHPQGQTGPVTNGIVVWTQFNY
jgi:hypothetical protein